VSEFIFMLTRSDATVPHALDVYDSIRDTELRWVGFKDIGQPTPVLKTLTERIHADGRSAVLEVVSVDEGSEVASVEAGLEIGVDLIMGGTRPDSVLPILAGHTVRYFPFPGQVIGHPSVLTGTTEGIVASAAAMSARTGVHGLDLLAYRFQGDVPDLIRRVIAVATGPVVAAGSIDSVERIAAVADAGAWAFTIGSSIFDGTLAPGSTVPEAIRMALSLSAGGQVAADGPA
jgi:4-hydroxythreonine-4-phosphate dehydrogenase